MFTTAKWQRIKSGFRGPEDFYPLKHVNHREWGSGFTLPDSGFFGINIYAPEECERMKFSITNLIHVTDWKGVQGILADKCLKKANKKQIGEDLKLQFSWWSVQVSQEELKIRRRAVKEQLRQTMEEKGVSPRDVGNLRDSLLEQFISSPAFLEVSNYGNFKFTYNINDLIGEYKKSVCKGEDPELRVLGTFKYNIEIMHTVVVHPPGEPIFQSCPPLPSEAISQEGPEWEWRPESTDSEVRGLTQDGDGSWKVINYSSDCRRWDFVSFAFYLPDENPEFPVPLEYRHLTVCEMESSQRHRPPYTYLRLSEAETCYRSLSCWDRDL